MRPPKPHRRQLSPSEPPGPLIEFRAIEDDAWYSCSTRVEEDAGCFGQETYLRVMYSGLPAELDQRFPTGMFDDEAEVEDFRGRFRPHSKQLQDSECRNVAKGTKVCASSVLKGAAKDDEVKFYDAVVQSIKHSVHKFDHRNEVCTCTFALLWSHGPNSGSLTTRTLENICIIQENREHLDHAVDCFLALALKKVAKPGCHAAALPRFEPDSLNIANGSTQVLEDESMEHGYEGLACELMQTMARHIDLGGSANLWKPFASDKEGYYFIVVENMEKNILPETIVDFIQRKTSICTQAMVFPSFYSESRSRGVIFVKTKERIAKITEFFGNSDQLIVSSRGRPWVIAEKKYNYGSILGSLSKFQIPCRMKTDENTSSILLVRKGTKEFEAGKNLYDLFLEFQKHVQGLHQALNAKESKIFDL